MRDVLTLILAGGRGSRLEPLTRDRAKPAVPFGGHYRIIDFTLSNAINSGLRRMFVLSQYKARSLDLHLRFGWSFLSPELGEFVDVLPPQQQFGEHWYKGTADAIYQNVYAIYGRRGDGFAPVRTLLPASARPRFRVWKTWKPRCGTR